MAAIKGVAEQRQLIVRAARRAIAQGGLAALRVRAVAADVGLSHATVLHYFGNKDDLIQAVVDSVIHSDLARPLVEDAEPVGPLAQLRRLMAELHETVGEDDDHGAVMMELLRHGRSAEVRPPLLGYTTVWRAYLADLIRQGQAGGEIRAELDPDAAASLVIEVTLGLQTRTPLPDGTELLAIDQLLGLLAA